MNESQVVKMLEGYRNSKFPILSLYLGSEEKKVPYPAYLISQLHSLIHQNLNKQEQKFWKKALEKIDAYLRQFFNRENNNHSVVFFVSDKNIWKVLEFEFFLPPMLIINNSPYLKPLEKVLGKDKKYLVLLVDREKARLFTVHLGKIEEQRNFFNDQVPQMVKAKKIDYGREDKIFRHIEEHLHRHLQLVAQVVHEFSKGKNIKFLIIGSHEELLPKIRENLLYPQNKMVIGEFVTEIDIPENDLLSEVITKFHI